MLVITIIVNDMQLSTFEFFIHPDIVPSKKEK